MNPFFHLARRLHSATPEFRGKWRLRRFLQRTAAGTTLPAYATVRTSGGFMLTLDTSDFLQRQVYLLGSWEREVSTEISACLRSGDVFVDIGADIGYHAIQAARIVGASGRVLAFEPNPRVHERLLANIRLNAIDTITALPIALSDQAGIAHFYPGAAGNTGAGSLRRNTANDAPIEVEVDTLDAVLTRTGVDAVAVLKIDIEGAELMALRGMRQLLARPDAPVVICEISEWSLAQFGHSSAELIAFMASCGYSEPRLISPKRRSIFSDAQDYYQYDVIFTKGGN
jgi:FkbM family methyltransferase